ncbi:hypothetical protein OHU34_46230 (plasmid) [Streptomyces sp. NBC_00080]|uniref:hypothetical protein n=1 Tax=Streptomyces sp. NBC_00080 TaxID=2975645 RepID=UPI002F90C22F
MSPSLTVVTPAGTVHATARPRNNDAIVFDLSGAMRGSVHVTGTHHVRYWDQFTAVRACLGPVNAFQETEPAPVDTLPRLACSRTGYRGSLTLYRDAPADRPQVSAYPMESDAGHEPSPKTAATLTAVLRACAENVEQRTDFPQILTASRERDTPALLRFLTWSADYHRSAAARLEGKARASRPALRAAVSAWWTVARWFTAQPHPVLLLMLANLDGSLARDVDVQEWWGPYCLTEASGEHDRARNAEAEAVSLRTQQRTRRTGRAPQAGTPTNARMEIA